MAESSDTGADSQFEDARGEQTNSDIPARPSTPTKEHTDCGEDKEGTQTQRNFSAYDAVSNHGDDGQGDERAEGPKPSISPVDPNDSSQLLGSPQSVPTASDSSESEQKLENQDDDDGYITEAAYLKAEEEYFETLRPQIHQLCLDLGLGAPSKIEHIEGGSYNRIVGLTLASSDNSECILRIPRMTFSEDHREREIREIRDQVAIHLHLAQYEFLRIPSIIAWDATPENSLGFQYVIQTKLQGATLYNVYYQLPLTERLEIATAVAEMLLKLETVTFENLGRLVGTEEVPTISDRAPTVTSPVQIAGYRHSPVEDGPVMEKQPITTFLSTLLEHRKQMNLGWVEYEKMCERLQEILLEMQKAGMMRVADNDSVLWHWDFSAANVLVHRKLESSERNTGGQSQALLESGSHKSVDEENPKACPHTVELKFYGSEEESAKHNVNIDLGSQGVQCLHELNIAIESLSGKTCHHIVQISGVESQLDGKKNETLSSTIPSNPKQLSSPFSSVEGMVAGKWDIGVLDWDDALAVPRILSRKPPQWLWLSEDGRPWILTEDRDAKPWRDLTEDELLIKAHFDQIMARADPNYQEDAYGRGRWLRALARFPIYNWQSNDEMAKLDQFFENWDAHYALISKAM